jgi:hypothetical protein
MTPRQLAQRINAAVAELGAYYPSAGDAFCHWAMETWFELDTDEALEACSVSGPGDKGIDAFWHDEQQRVVIIAQAKYSKRTHTFTNKVVLELEAGLSWLRRLREPERGTTANEELLAAAEVLAALRSEDTEYPIRLYCFSNGRFSQSAMEQAAAFNAEHKHNDIALVLVDIDELADRVTELSSRAKDAPHSDIELHLQRYFEFSNDPAEPRTVVASINVQELAELERKYRYRIFQRNVRYWLKSTNRVNRSIADTLGTVEGRGHFWYYNNGIAIVCDAVTVQASSDSPGGAGVAKVRNLQIVNGCQTTTTLGETIAQLEDPDSPAFVLVRIFETTEQRLQSDISLYNNRQNAVKDRDLLSNDDPQATLQTDFDQLAPPWFYQRKRGEWDAQIKPHAARKRRYGNGARLIDNEGAAQAAYAFWYDAAVARARKRMLFVRKSDDENGLYDEIFTSNTTAEWLLLPFRIHEYVNSRKREFLPHLKSALEVAESDRTTEQERTIQRTWIKFADQVLVGAIRVLLSEVVDLRQHRVQVRLLSQDVFGPLIERAYAQAIRDLNPFFRQKRADARKHDQPFDVANYVKGNWRDVESWLRDQSEYRREAGEDPFDDIELAA